MQPISIEYFGPGTILGAGVTGVSKRDKNPCPLRAYFLVRGRDNKQIKKNIICYIMGLGGK